MEVLGDFFFVILASLQVFTQPNSSQKTSVAEKMLILSLFVISNKQIETVKMRFSFVPFSDIKI